MVTSDFRLGILGGGQLGRMLIQSAIDFNLHISVLDPDADAPCRNLATEFHIGSLTDYDTVLNFGKDKSLITIEIENVNTEALEALQKLGVKVYPQPDVIRTIQDKRVQKQFYKSKNIPTSEFRLIEGKEEVKKHSDFLPAFQKLGRSGYDGRGVQRIASVSDFDKAFDGESLLEKLVDYEKEISVIVARNENGQVVAYPPVEMAYHPEKNLVEFLFSPADLSPQKEKEAQDIAVKVISELKMVGLLAVEMFLSKTGEILVNESAPRPHNSGHQSIKANYTSQYEQHLRAILNLPLGSVSITKPAAMVNVLGAEGYSGKVKYVGAEKILAIDGVYLHLYGKSITKPFRKMGHITILDEDKERLKQKARIVKDEFKVISE